MEYDIEIDFFGNKIYYKKGKRFLHREDGPAVEYANGDKSWYINGKRNRLDGPAREWTNGYKEWWIDGKRHRSDGPAVIFGNGDKEWWVDGKLLSPEKELILNKWWDNKNC